MCVAIVGLLGLYLRSRQETTRLHKEIDENHLQHRMGVYHNVLSLASKLEHSSRSETSVHRGGAGGAINEKFKEEVDGLAVFGASEPRRHALAMRAVLERADRATSPWVDEFAAAKEAFMNAAHKDVGPDARGVAVDS
jgi:hypothetical protein